MRKVLIRLLWFIGLVLLQVFVLNHIQWFGVATPFFYIYFVLTADSDISRDGLMLWAFAIGLAIDIFSNTFGIHAASATLIAFLRPTILRLFFLRDDSELFEPGIASMSAGAFWHYALVCTVLHCTAINLLEFFSFSHPFLLILRILACTLLTMVFVMGVEFIRYRKL